MNTTFKKENIIYVAVGMLAAALLLFVAIPLLSTEKIFDTTPGASLGVLVVHADDGGADGGAGGGGGAGDGGSGGSDGSGADGGATGGASGGGGCCGGEPGASADGGTPGGSVGDFGGSEVAYVPTVTPIPQMSGNISASAGACVPGVAKRYVTVSWNTQNAQLSVVQMVSANFGGNLFTPTANTSGTLNLEYGTGAYKFGIVGGRDGSWVTFKNADLFLNADDCLPTVTPPVQMTGSITATVGACVPGVPKRYVDVSWQTQNAQLTVAQAAGGQYGGGINLISPTSNNSGNLRVEVSAGAYVFAVAGHNTSWVTLQNVHRVITTDDCVPTTVTWSPYCTGADDPNGNKWQWWEKSNTNPIQYRFLRAGDGSCVPPVGPVCPAGTTGTYPNCVTPPILCPSGTTGTYPNCVVPQPVCPTGTSGSYPNCIVINNNNNNTNNNTNTNNNVITINTPTPQTQVIYRDSGSRSRSSSRSDYRYNDYGACTITVSPTVVAYGQSTTLSWSSNSGNSGWIEGVGNVSAYGSMQTTPTRSGVYTGRFVGNNGQTITCSAYVTVSGAYVAPISNTPYVSLASVPYTGLELGPYGTVIYWSFLVLWCLFAAYLVAVKKVQNNIANWFAGKRHAEPAHAHEVHAEHVAHDEMPTYTYREDAVDAFIAQQLKLVQK